MDVKNIYKFPIIQRDFSKIYTGAICEKHKILQNIRGYFKKLWRPHVKKKNHEVCKTREVYQNLC